MTAPRPLPAHYGDHSGPHTRRSGSDVRVAHGPSCGCGSAADLCRRPESPPSVRSGAWTPAAPALDRECPAAACHLRSAPWRRPAGWQRPGAALRPASFCSCWSWAQPGAGTSAVSAAHTPPSRCLQPAEDRLRSPPLEPFCRNFSFSSSCLSRVRFPDVLRDGWTVASGRGGSILAWLPFFSPLPGLPELAHLLLSWAAAPVPRVWVASSTLACASCFVVKTLTSSSLAFVLAACCYTWWLPQHPQCLSHI